MAECDGHSVSDSESEGSLDLSCASSDFVDGEGDDRYAGHVAPYQFEPLDDYQSCPGENDTSEDENVDRIGYTAW